MLELIGILFIFIIIDIVDAKAVKDGVIDYLITLFLLLKLLIIGVLYGINYILVTPIYS